MIKARLWSQKFFKGSVRLASIIESEFTEIGRNSLGVLQRNEKGIWVLQATNMPAVLVETGFITNQEEEDYLNSDNGQKEMVAAIAKAVVKYKTLVDAPRSSITDSSSTSNKKTTPPAPTVPVKTSEKPLAVMPPTARKGK
jgi:N-acetylmuramoyl-L-alanine amidase